jgi:hypothetical protein
MQSDIKITTTISRESLECIFATAFEGGSNYWARITNEQWDIVDEATKDSIYVENNARNIKYDDRFNSSQIDILDAHIHGLTSAMVATILDAKVDIEINCVENNDEVLGTLSVDTLKNRLQSLSDHSNYSRFLYAELNGEGDAESSDVIFQYLVLGEVIYG